MRPERAAGTHETASTDMAITSAGVGSGLDINSLVTQLMSIERQPLNALNKKEDGYNAQLSSYGKLKSALSDFRSAMQALSSADKFKVYSVTSSDEDTLTATADSTASRGSSEIVVTTLAKNHKLASGTFTNSSSTVGTGTLTVTVGSDAFSVTVDSSNNTLAGIRDAINAAPDNSGVTATVLNEVGGSRLVLTADDTGSTHELKIEVTGDGDGNNTNASGLSRLVWVSGGTQNMSEITPADDAAFTVDGYSVTSASNTVTDAIEGVTLTLKEEAPTTTVALTVARDTAAIEDSVEEFVTAYNALRKTIASLRSGNLKGDSTLNAIEAGIRNVLNTPPSGLTTDFTYLAGIGVSIQKDGTMQLDGGDLSDALDSDFAGVAELFSDDSQGFAVRLEGLMDTYLKADGTIEAREDGLNDRIKLLDTRQAQLEERLTRVERRLRSQFSGMDALVSQLRASGDYLTNQLSRL